MPSDNIDNVRESGPHGDSQPDGSHHSSAAPPQTKSASTSGNETAPTTTARRETQRKDALSEWFAIPAPLKRLFDNFPLVTYSKNAPPVLASATRDGNTLYIFTTPEGAEQGRASFNPNCLKWQTYLRMAAISFKTIPSNNHASPSGSLPFLSIPPAQASKTSDTDITLAPPELVHGSRLKRWVQGRQTQTKSQASDDVRYEVYTSLLEGAIRKAWLYQLYLNPSNAAVAKRLYVEPCSSNPFVQMTIASQLRSAAQAEIVKASAQNTQWARIDESELLRDAEEAFSALSTLLTSADWFFAEHDPQVGPSLFDASVFAYTHLILDPVTGDGAKMVRWNENPLSSLLERHPILVRHRERIVEMYY